MTTAKTLINRAFDPICKIIHEQAFEACNRQDIYRVAQHVQQLRTLEKMNRDLRRSSDNGKASHDD